MAATLTSIGGLPSSAVPMTSNLLAFTIKIPKIHATSDRGRETIKCGRVVCGLVETERRLSVKEVGLVLVQSNCYFPPVCATRFHQEKDPFVPSLCRSLSSLSPAQSASIHFHHRPSHPLNFCSSTCRRASAVGCCLTPQASPHLTRCHAALVWTRASTVTLESSYYTRISSHGDSRRCSHGFGAVHTRW